MVVYKMCKNKHLRHYGIKVENQFKQNLSVLLVRNEHKVTKNNQTQNSINNHTPGSMMRQQINEENKQKINQAKFQQQNKVCIIFLHGYGSNKLQGLTLVDQLPKDMDLCSFDFSASGKSQGSMTTYGLKQFKDIRAIIKKLKSQEYRYQKFILWGRSMGAVASFLLLSSPETIDKQIQKDVIFQVLDSPFSTFQTICYYQGKVSIKLPQPFISYGLTILKDYFKDYPKQTNPFHIDLLNVAPNCHTSTLFVYSQNDSIIPASNTLQIIQKLPKHTYYQKLLIEENHNSLRKQSTNQEIFLIIRKGYRKWVYNNKISKAGEKFVGLSQQTLGVNFQKVLDSQKHINNRINNTNKINKKFLFISPLFNQKMQKDQHELRTMQNVQISPDDDQIQFKTKNQSSKNQKSNINAFKRQNDQVFLQKQNTKFQYQKNLQEGLLNFRSLNGQNNLYCNNNSETPIKANQSCINKPEQTQTTPVQKVKIPLILFKSKQSKHMNMRLLTKKKPSFQINDNVNTDAQLNHFNEYERLKQFRKQNKLRQETVQSIDIGSSIKKRIQNYFSLNQSIRKKQDNTNIVTSLDYRTKQTQNHKNITTYSISKSINMNPEIDYKTIHMNTNKKQQNTKKRAIYCSLGKQSINQKHFSSFRKMNSFQDTDIQQGVNQQ